MPSQVWPGPFVPSAMMSDAVVEDVVEGLEQRPEQSDDEMLPATPWNVGDERGVLMTPAMMPGDRAVGRRSGA